MGLPNVVVAAAPCIVCVASAVLLAPSPWCFGAARFFAAVCFSAGGASGTLLACWALYPQKRGRSMACAVLGAIASGAPLWTW
jgi:hypothetical protein